MCRRWTSSSCQRSNDLMAKANYIVELLRYQNLHLVLQDTNDTLMFCVIKDLEHNGLSMSCSPQVCVAFNMLFFFFFFLKGGRGRQGREGGRKELISGSRQMKHRVTFRLHVQLKNFLSLFPSLRCLRYPG